MPRSLFDKIWDQHAVAETSDGAHLIAIDRIFLHERTGAVALQSLTERGRRIRMPEHVFCTVDHIVETLPGQRDRARMPGGEVFIRSLREGARAQGLTAFDVGDPSQGIVHVIAPELGLSLPGTTIICPDSHTCTQGALGAIAWGIGSSDAEHALATTALWLDKPRQMRIAWHGRLGSGVGAKDMILSLIARHSADGGKGCAIEFAGPVVESLGIEERMTLCNMAVEFGAFTGLIAPDEKTVSYLRGRAYAPKGALWETACTHWRGLASDRDAGFDAEIVGDAGKIAPMVSWGTNPAQTVAIDRPVPDPSEAASAETRSGMERALAYMGLAPKQPMEGLALDGVFIGSCTNARLSDLRRAAAILAGRRVAPGLRAICVPGSTAVKRAAEAEGLDHIFIDAGFEWHESGCSLCFYAGGTGFASEDRVLSSTNRNFQGRQGPGVRTHLASPETVAASAVTGRIADCRAFPPER